MRRYVKILFAVFFLFSLFTPAELLAAPYYKGKVLTIVVGYGPGGGYDRTARLVAKHLPRFIPGNPAVIVENQPGADSMIAANYIFNMAKPDGFTIGTFNRGLPYAQLLKAPGVKYDIMKFAWIGSAASEATVIVVQSGLPYTTFKDLLKSKTRLNFGSMGPSDSSAQFPAMLREYAGLNVKLIVYPSSSDVMLAVERKELDGRGASYSSVKPFVDRGVVRVLLRGRVTQPGLEKMPVDEDFAADKKGRAVMAMRSATDIVGRPFVAPPKTPPATMKILQDAFAKMLNDPEVKADAAKLMMDVNYVPPAETLKVFREVFNQPKDIIQEFAKIVKF
jgi:tripartite-type tricarboxylate transporter receptor subunit TctC